MADSNQNHSSKTEVETEEERLKYLEFVQIGAQHAVGCATRVYDYAKDNSGPLKTGVESVEGTVKTVVGPVYDKIHDVPVEVLKYVDRKVDESVTKLDNHVPCLVKQASSRALAVASEVKNGNASGLAKTTYEKFEPVAEQYAVSAWRKLNHLPLFTRVTQALLPTAAYCTEKYNSTVQSTHEQGYRVSSYLPLVPTERIAKVFAEKDGSECDKDSDNGSDDGSDDADSIVPVGGEMFVADNALTDPAIETQTQTQ